MVKVKVVGYEQFMSKNGKLCTSISVTSPIERRDSHKICTGQKAESFFVPDHLIGKVSADDVGKELNVYTAYFSNRNNLIDIIR